VTSSVAAFKAPIRKKINVYVKPVTESKKKRKYDNSRNVHTNLHLKDGFGMEFTACVTSWCQKERWHHLLYRTWRISHIRHS